MRQNLLQTINNTNPLTSNRSRGEARNTNQPREIISGKISVTIHKSALRRQYSWWGWNCRICRVRRCNWFRDSRVLVNITVYISEVCVVLNQEESSVNYDDRTIFPYSSWALYLSIINMWLLQRKRVSKNRKPFQVLRSENISFAMPSVTMPITDIHGREKNISLVIKSISTKPAATTCQTCGIKIKSCKKIADTNLRHVPKIFKDSIGDFQSATSADTENKHFLLHVPVGTYSSYWNLIHGRRAIVQASRWRHNTCRRSIYVMGELHRIAQASLWFIIFTWLLCYLLR